jgi:lysophospholipase L1-like esterase
LVRIAFFGDSITVGIPGASYVRILQQRLPQHTFRNYSKINATPLSLYHHVKNAIRPTDMAFVFLGVNDLLIGRSWLFSHIRQQWARNDNEFLDHYRLLLDTVAPCAQQVITVSPLFIGEDFDSLWQQRLGQRGDLIAQLGAQYPNARYLDVRSTFMRELNGKPVVKGIGQALGQSVWDGLTLHTDATITRVAASRNLYYTLDGVHLNVAGAQIMAEACLQAISSLPV